MDTTPEYTDYTLVTTLPRSWVKWIDNLIVFLAKISGHIVVVSRVMRAGDDDEPV
jgi:hypothetical protein